MKIMEYLHKKENRVFQVQGSLFYSSKVNTVYICLLVEFGYAFSKLLGSYL